MSKWNRKSQSLLHENVSFELSLGEKKPSSKMMWMCQASNTLQESTRFPKSHEKSSCCLSKIIKLNIKKTQKLKLLHVQDLPFPHPPSPATLWCIAEWEPADQGRKCTSKRFSLLKILKTIQNNGKSFSNFWEDSDYLRQNQASESAMSCEKMLGTKP